MHYVITALQPGTIGLRFDQPPSETLLTDLAAPDGSTNAAIERSG